ncbi:MAG: hypothetical protein JO033_13820, partial [Acidobacteriaceae bacterium]|nr:hypothetical protein [Acidobacteriaceae bacterium]
MNTRAARVLFLWLFFGAVWLWASQPWSKDPGQWTSADVKRMLSDSPWAKSTNATFPNGESEEKPPPAPLPGPESAGMAGPRGVSDGRWDGGVGRMP